MFPQMFPPMKIAQKVPARLPLENQMNEIREIPIGAIADITQVNSLRGPETLSHYALRKKDIH